MRHAIEARHESFADPAFVALARARGAAIALAGGSPYPEIADPTADFVYARIMGAREGEALGYAAAVLDLWAERARRLAQGETPDGLRRVAEGSKAAPRDVFLFVISGFKPANPAAARALIARLKRRGDVTTPEAPARAALRPPPPRSRGRAR